MKKIQSIDTVLQELDLEESQHNVLRVIYSYYLTDREKDFYHAFLLNLSGKPQKEIGILLSLLQHKVSVFTSLLLHKMRRLARLFTEERDTFDEFIYLLKRKLQPSHYATVSLMLGGNRDTDIARHLRCSPPNIFKLRVRLKKHLSPQEYKNLLKYLDIIRG